MKDDIINNEDYNLTKEEFEEKKENYRWKEMVGGESYQAEYFDEEQSNSYEWNSNLIDEKLIDNDLLFLDAPRTKPTNWWLIVTIIIGAYFIISSYIFNIILMPLQVVGASMYPTLNSDDREDTSDVVYIKETQDINVGDIIVMNALDYTESESYYIKRVVAKGGDSVQFIKADNNLYADSTGAPCGLFYLYVNGERVYENYINDETPESDGTMYLRLDIAENIYQETIVGQKKIVVPDGEFYVLGDNRRVSNDSKYFGTVKQKDVVGKVVIHRAYGENLFVALFNSIKNKYIFK